MPTAPLPSPSGPPAQLACVRWRANQWFANAPPHPLPSQGREQELAAEAAPTKARGFESSTAVPLDGEHMLHARLALEHGHPLTRHPQARLVQHAQARQVARVGGGRSEEHTSELQSLLRISYAVFCLKKNKTRRQ